MAVSKRKHQSRRFWAAIWAMACATAIMIAAIVFRYDAQWIGITLPMLIGIVIVWIGAESYTKTHQPNREAEGGEP